MKKIVLLIMILLLTGCFEDSGKLVTTCTKNEKINTLNIETVYIIDFKSDKINNVEVSKYYNDSNTNTISSIKSSINSTDRFIEGLNRSIKINTNNEFKIIYNIKPETSKEIKDKYLVSESRTDLVKKLKEQGYECN